MPISKCAFDSISRTAVVERIILTSCCYLGRTAEPASRKVSQLPAEKDWSVKTDNLVLFLKKLLMPLEREPHSLHQVFP